MRYIYVLTSSTQPYPISIKKNSFHIKMVVSLKMV
ncbi:hypothetical protein MED222_05900 [Vibrio sp. MED222]|nr:hypothetical protein MED222_05900 [Vibrio sp. MED222]